MRRAVVIPSAVAAVAAASIAVTVPAFADDADAPCTGYANADTLPAENFDGGGTGVAYSPHRRGLHRYCLDGQGSSFRLTLWFKPTLDADPIIAKQASGTDVVTMLYYGRVGYYMWAIRRTEGSGGATLHWSDPAA